MRHRDPKQTKQKDVQNPVVESADIENGNLFILTKHYSYSIIADVRWIVVTIWFHINAVPLFSTSGGEQYDGHPSSYRYITFNT